ncbi:MAG: rod shape-determining protein MreC [Candidatus Omnitrophica bacterium]|nr:rod shape-determining protein MreC [Candidatus Omnitrophota bacterium]MCF7894245.1 rod shape-determining protein MreC [Candidatus Omnitrophota bacterium]
MLSLSESFSSLSKSSYQNKLDQLRKKNLKYQLKLKQFKNLSEENKLLREALNFKNKDDLGLIGAEIIAFAPSSWHKYIFLNLGKNKKVKKNMLVVDKDGNLIGKIEEVYPQRCKVILIKNPDFQTPVSINNRVLGLLQGTLSGVEVLYIEKSNQINISEPIYAAFSPFNSVVKVGEISKIKTNKSDLFYEVQVDTSAKDKLPQVVFILK